MGFSDLPIASGVQHQKAFASVGWVVRRSGNHITMTHPGRFGVTLSIPNHKQVKLGTLKVLVRDAGLSDKQYRAIFDLL